MIQKWESLSSAWQFIGVKYLTHWLAERSAQKCLQWTWQEIECALDKADRDELITRTIGFIRLVIENPEQSEAAKDLEQLAWENWREKNSITIPIRAKLILARFCWAYHSYLIEMPSRNTGSTCGEALSVLIYDKPEQVMQIKSSFERFVEGLES